MFVLSSDYEGMPNALIEAMVLGLPCISTNCKCGPSSLIVDGLNGLLIPIRDETSLVQAMCYIAENEEQALTMGRKAVLIKEKLDTNKIAERWEKYLEYIYKNKLDSK
jgi:glycosyltransferase involved in cell wall biosynthesis